MTDGKYLLQEGEESERGAEGETRDDAQWEGGETGRGLHPAQGLLLPPEHQVLTEYLYQQTINIYYLIRTLYWIFTIFFNLVNKQ